jgi:hypothetical protein
MATAPPTPAGTGDSSSTWCVPATDADHVVPGQPKIGEREVVAALLERNHHLIRTGQILLADKGFAGKEFKQLTDAMGLRLLRPDRKDETYRNGNLGGQHASGSSQSTRASKDSSTSKTTAAGPPPGCSPASPNGSWLWPPASGTTGPPASPANDH